MQKENYADELAQIHYTGNMVRLDFATANINADESRNAFRVIMPLRGCLSTYDMMKNMIDRLLAAGVFQKNAFAAQEPSKKEPEPKVAETKAAAKPVKSDKPAKKAPKKSAKKK